MVSWTVKLLVAFLTALLVLIIASTQGANWVLSLILSGATFLLVLLFITFFVVERDPRYKLLDEITKGSKKDARAQVDRTRNQRNYRQETRGKFFKEQNEACALEGKVYNPKSDKCVRQFDQARGY